MFSYYDFYRPKRLRVAELRERAASKVARMRRAGKKIAPVEISGSQVATTFWGTAWCDSIEAQGAYDPRLPRGKSYARHGAVIDLQVDGGSVRSLVQGTRQYVVKIEIEPLERKVWADIRRQCSGKIDSMVELLQGSVSKGVMKIVTRRANGLLPSPDALSVFCTCRDWAGICKHAAAALYGIGSRLDSEPELLFSLRGVDISELAEDAVDQAAGNFETSGKRSISAGRTLSTDEVSTVFGIDFGETPPEAPSKRRSGSASRGSCGKGQTGTGGAGEGERFDSGNYGESNFAELEGLTREQLEGLEARIRRAIAKDDRNREIAKREIVATARRHGFALEELLE